MEEDCTFLQTNASFFCHSFGIEGHRLGWHFRLFYELASIASVPIDRSLDAGPLIHFFTLTLEHVIVIGCIVMVIGLLATHWQARRSLRWWYGRQSMNLRWEAEEIRNGLLQESFILRRKLELLRANPGGPLIDTEPTDGCLETLEKFHGSLKDLSDRLSLPFIDESLPHAIQHLLESWQARYPAIVMNTSFPAEWLHDRYEHRRVILMVLDELCQMTLSELSTSDSIMVSLQQHGQKGKLIAQFTYSSPSTLRSHAEISHLKYLQQIFRFLTPGNCSYRFTNSTMTWWFDWKLTDTQLE